MVSGTTSLHFGSLDYHWLISLFHWAYGLKLFHMAVTCCLYVFFHSFIAWTMVNLNLVLWDIGPIPKMVSASILHLLLGCIHSPYSRPMFVRGIFEICLVAIPVVCYLRYNSTTPFVCWVVGHKTISHRNVMFTGQSKIGWKKNRDKGSYNK